jgi:hypothetical protein
VDRVPNILLRKSRAPGLEPGTSGSVARNSDHWTTEPVHLMLQASYKFTDATVPILARSVTNSTSGRTSTRCLLP